MSRQKKTTVVDRRPDMTTLQQTGPVLAGFCFWWMLTGTPRYTGKELGWCLKNLEDLAPAMMKLMNGSWLPEAVATNSQPQLVKAFCPCGVSGTSQQDCHNLVFPVIALVALLVGFGVTTAQMRLEIPALQEALTYVPTLEDIELQTDALAAAVV